MGPPNDRSYPRALGEANRRRVQFANGEERQRGRSERFRGSVDVGGGRPPVEEVDVTATFADEASDEVSAFRPETDEWQMCERL